MGHILYDSASVAAKTRHLLELFEKQTCRFVDPLYSLYGSHLV
jgi:hypothetical protein